MIPRSDMLEAQAHDFKAGSSSAARVETPVRDKEMSRLRGEMKGLAGAYEALSRHCAGAIDTELV